MRGSRALIQKVCSAFDSRSSWRTACGNANCGPENASKKSPVTISPESSISRSAGNTADQRSMPPSRFASSRVRMPYRSSSMRQRSLASSSRSMASCTHGGPVWTPGTRSPATPTRHPSPAPARGFGAAGGRAPCAARFDRLRRVGSMQSETSLTARSEGGEPVGGDVTVPHGLPERAVEGVGVSAAESSSS